MAALTGMDKKRLRIWLMLFFVALAAPSGILIQQAYSQLKWQSFHQHRLIAEELAARIDSNLRRLVDREESRSFTDYQFLVFGGQAKLNYLQRSPLSNFPVSRSLPGLIGYFQVDSEGILSTPLLPQEANKPDVTGIAEQEFDKRLRLQNHIREILSRNKLVGNGKADRKPSPVASDRRDLDNPAQPAARNELEKGASIENRQEIAEQVPRITANDLQSSQSAFDRLNSAMRQSESRKKQQAGRAQGKIADFNLDYSYQSGLAKAPLEQQPKKKIAPESKRLPRKERVTVAAAEPQFPNSFSDFEPALSDEIRIHTFESEIDPFEFSLLDSGHFVLFRKVWRNGQRYIQGILLEQKPFLDGMVESAFEESSLSTLGDLIIAFQGTVFSAIKRGASMDIASGALNFSGSVLYQTRLSPPLTDFDLVFSVTRLPPGPGAKLIAWTGVALSGVLVAGFILMYRTGVAQIKTVRQQRNFVSAISHELKTPLTSIRMYSEMLREGWTSEEKKLTYYNYILSESERLTRLINNVLQLAKLGRGEMRIEIQAIPAGILIEEVRQKVLSQVEGAGFQLEVSIDSDTRVREVETDADAFTQMIINLVDNAIKFSSKSDRKIIELGCKQLIGGPVQFSVRDFGPGIAPNQMKKIFRLFYRPENELTRETVGTGIGLALVRQLAGRMQGRVDVVNRFPGAEFRIVLPVVT